MLAVVEDHHTLIERIQNVFHLDQPIGALRIRVHVSYWMHRRPLRRILSNSVSASCHGPKRRGVVRIIRTGFDGNVNGNGKHKSARAPRARPLVGMALALRKDPLAGMRQMARDYGDVVRFYVMMQERTLVNRPDLINQVLVIQQSKFHKSELTRRITSRMLGQGLLISEGEFWRRQRRLAQPAFHRSRINEYGATMLELAENHISGWRDGEQRNISQEMTALTLDIAVKTLFGTTLPSEGAQSARP